MSSTVVILLSVILSVGLVATAAWLGRAWLWDKLRGMIKGECAEKLDAARDKLQTQAETRMETMKAQLRTQADERLEAHRDRLQSQSNEKLELLKLDLKAQAEERLGSLSDTLRTQSESKLETLKHEWRAQTGDRLSGIKDQMRDQTDATLGEIRNELRTHTDQTLEAHKDQLLAKTGEKLEALKEQLRTETAEKAGALSQKAEALADQMQLRAAEKLDALKKELRAQCTETLVALKEELQNAVSREAEMSLEARKALHDGVTTMATAAHAMGWLTWIAQNSSLRFNEARVKAHDEEMHALMPRIIAFPALLATFNPTLGARFGRLAALLQALDGKIAAASIRYLDGALASMNDLGVCHEEARTISEELARLCTDESLATLLPQKAKGEGNSASDAINAPPAIAPASVIPPLPQAPTGAGSEA